MDGIEEGERSEKEENICNFLRTAWLAVFCALGAPLSKMLLREVPPLFAASFLYPSAGFSAYVAALEVA